MNKTRFDKIEQAITSHLFYTYNHAKPLDSNSLGKILSIYIYIYI